MTPRRQRPGEGLGYQATLVLSALARGARYGLEVIETTGLSSGTVYPALRRLEADALLSGDWEGTEGAHQQGRPARRYYQVTPLGEEALAEALERIRSQQRALGWVPETNG